MAMHTEALTTSWYQVEDLDDPTFVMVIVEGDDAEVSIDATEPASAAGTFPLPEGIWRLDIPEGKFAWLKSAGTTDVTYSKFDGVLFDVDECVTGYSDDVTSGGVGDEDFSVGVNPIAGFNDTGAVAYRWKGILCSVAAGISASATIDEALLRLALNTFRPGETISIKGIEAASAVASSIADFSDLDTSLTLTTAQVVWTVGIENVQSIDITAILDELIGVSGWDASSPVQLMLDISGTYNSSVDGRVTVEALDRRTVIYTKVS